jgi:hypothetical protein
MIGGMARWWTLLAVAIGLVVVTAVPAGADAAGPSDYRSQVTGIVPDVEGVGAEIRGGDAFLEVSVEDGRTVIVEGYQGEPYLRFLPDGTVERNRLSTATYLNDDRRGAEVVIPPEAQEADADTPPEWEEVGDGGTYAWHDHRVHWMQDASPGVGRGEQVGGAYDPWRVPIVVDGAPAEIQGTLTYEPSPSPLPSLAIAVLSGAAVAVYLKGGLRWPSAVLAAVAALALVVGRSEFSSTPAGGGNPLLWVLPAVALVAALGAVALAKRLAGVTLALVSVATLFGWALFRIQSLRKPVRPSDLPAPLDRASVALAAGVSVGVAYLAVAAAGRALPSLEDDE